MKAVTVQHMEVGKKYYLVFEARLKYICCLKNGQKVAICIEDTTNLNSSFIGSVVDNHDLSHFYPIIEEVAYMVTVEGGKAPSYTHGFLSDANKEAERLALNNPGKVVRVLSVVRKIRAEVTTKLVELRDDVIPF